LIAAPPPESFLDIKHLDIKVIVRTEPKTYEPPDPGGVHLWLVLWKASRTLLAHAEKSIESLDMGWSDFGVMEALLHKGPLPIKALGEKVLLTSGSITSAIDRLERHGWVERTTDGNDRRSRIVQLTPDGKKIIREAFASHRKHMEAAVSGLDTQDRLVLIDLLRRLGQDAQGRLQSQSSSKERK
jgi:MarR family transcriptional regulator, 2-MHQ and catechol-resistance regulon repressor